jgi:hypothetical protein
LVEVEGRRRRDIKDVPLEDKKYRDINEYLEEPVNPYQDESLDRSQENYMRQFRDKK